MSYANYIGIDDTIKQSLHLSFILEQNTEEHLISLSTIDV